ncbi:hypothetical protein A9R05_00735 [Burkholderia sp. KK1]|nr:hypothetical protein A9R05_00735 [Burkholderia sp. KK1]
MVEVVVICEGQTEETFVKGVLGEALAASNIFLTPRLIPTSSGQRGGALNHDRVIRMVRATLMERANTYVTTFFDLYGLDTSFAGVAESRGIDPSERALNVERQFRQQVIDATRCRAERFFPHIQPHEFEALLFSNVQELCASEQDWQISLEELHAVCARVTNPEWINDSPQTAPSKRLERLRPRYRKAQHGPDIAARIGIAAILEKCPHFRQWYERLSALPQL